MWHWGQNEDQRQHGNNFSQESAAQHIVGIGDHNIILFPTFTNDSFLLPHLLRNMFCNDKVENLSSFAPCEHWRTANKNNLTLNLKAATFLKNFVRAVWSLTRTSEMQKKCEHAFLLQTADRCRQWRTFGQSAINNTQSFSEIRIFSNNSEGHIEEKKWWLLALTDTANICLFDCNEIQAGLCPSKLTRVWISLWHNSVEVTKGQNDNFMPKMFCHGCADMSSWSATQRDCCLMQFLETHMHPLSTVIWWFGECSCQTCQMKTCFCCPMISTDIALLTCMVAGCSCSPKNGFMVRKSFTFCAIVSRANLLCCKIQAQNSVWNCCLAKADGTIWPTWRHFQFQKALSSTMSTIATQTFAFICPLNEHWFGQLGVWNQVLFCDQWLNKATIHVWGNWCCDSFMLCMFVLELMNNHPGWLQKKTDNSRHIRSSVFVDTQGTPIAKRILLTPNQMTNLSSVDNWQQLLPAQGWRTSVSWLCSDASKSGSIFQFLWMAKCLISVWDGVLQCEMGFCFSSRIFSASMWGRELGLLLLGRQLSDWDERSRTVLVRPQALLLVRQYVVA